MSVVWWHVRDGSPVVPGDVVAEVAGPLRPILTAERTALNFLGHLSGVATLTRRFVDAVAAVNPTAGSSTPARPRPGCGPWRRRRCGPAAATTTGAASPTPCWSRTTTWPALGITEAVRRARAMWPGRMVEVECDRPDQVAEASRAGATAVLLDNMTPERGRGRASALARRAARWADVLVEVSGGMTLETAPAYAAAGVDLISVGALTHSAPVLDLGLDLRDVTERGED